MNRLSGVDTAQWFAVRTKSNRETAVTDALAGKGYEVWCPRFTAVRRYTIPSNKPVFPGYLFCRFNVLDRLPVLTVPGVVNVVSNGRVPLAIDETEIASLRIVMDSILPVSASSYIQAGDKVRITAGPLIGAEGYVVHRECEHLVVSITLLQRSVSVAVQDEWLERTCRVAA